MKRTLLVVAACTIAFAVPVSGQQKGEKDECLLYLENCANQSLTIQQKVKKLNTEVKKGKKVYSVEELKRLEQKLKEANEMLDSLNSQGGGGR